MSDFLFVTPSFLRGMARTLDFGGILAHASYNQSEDGPTADAWAIANDWYAVGGDLKRSMETATRTHGQEAKSGQGNSR